jgi:hypothetical protein
MTRRKLDKKISALEPFCENIFVCTNKKLRPFLETFVYEPENVTQQSLGTLLGIFEITDTSEDSSYIVNYLISVIKKEYSSRPKRGAIESFEAALHKANLALSKLAEHENIKWIGKFNALVAIIEKNNLCLSRAGNVSAFLLRSKSFVDISEGLASSEEKPNPLKTFVNISSGRLENMDKLIIVTETIFNVFSPEEIKKSALCFTEENFIQFLKTALNNELEKAAVLVVDIKEKMEPCQSIYAEKKPVNAFSSAAFLKFKKSNQAESRNSFKTQSTKENTKNATEKTNHLYIKESEKIMPEQTKFADFFLTISELTDIFWKKFIKATKKFSHFSINLVKNIFRLRSKILVSTSLPVTEKIITPVKNLEKLRSFKFLKFNINISSAASNLKKISFFLFPNFSRLKKINAHLNYQQRTYVVLILLFIVFMPVLAIKIQKNIRSKNIESVAETPLILPLTQDKNVSRVENLNIVFTDKNISGIINLNKKFFGFTNTEILSLENQEKFTLPLDFEKTKLMAGMDDLNLIFLINQKNKLASWSPVSKKFNFEEIVVPENFNVNAIGAYLTYLYLVDGKNNQIYRYPRAGNGFGIMANWLKDTTDLSQTSSITLNDNVFTTDGTNIIKLFRGKKVEFNLESSATTITPAKIWTKRNSQNLYILDAKNSRVVKFDVDGNIISQFYNSEIGLANDFAIDEQNNTIYFATSTAIKSFAMN